MQKLLADLYFEGVSEMVKVSHYLEAIVDEFKMAYHVFAVSHAFFFDLIRQNCYNYYMRISFKNADVNVIRPLNVNLTMAKSKHSLDEAKIRYEFKKTKLDEKILEVKKDIEQSDEAITSSSPMYEKLVELENARHALEVNFKRYEIIFNNVTAKETIIDRLNELRRTELKRLKEENEGIAYKQQQQAALSKPIKKKNSGTVDALDAIAVPTPKKSKLETTDPLVANSFKMLRKLNEVNRKKREAEMAKENKENVVEKVVDKSKVDSFDMQQNPLLRLRKKQNKAQYRVRTEEEIQGEIYDSILSAKRKYSLPQKKIFRKLMLQHPDYLPPTHFKQHIKLPVGVDFRQNISILPDPYTTKNLAYNGFVKQRLFEFNKGMDVALTDYNLDAWIKVLVEEKKTLFEDIEPRYEKIARFFFGLRYAKPKTTKYVEGMTLINRDIVKKQEKLGVLNLDYQSPFSFNNYYAYKFVSSKQLIPPYERFRNFLPKRSILNENLNSNLDHWYALPRPVIQPTGFFSILKKSYIDFGCYLDNLVLSSSFTYENPHSLERSTWLFDQNLVNEFFYNYTEATNKKEKKYAFRILLDRVHDDVDYFEEMRKKKKYYEEHLNSTVFKYRIKTKKDYDNVAREKLNLSLMERPFGFSTRRGSQKIDGVYYLDNFYFPEIAKLTDGKEKTELGSAAGRLKAPSFRDCNFYIYNDNLQPVDLFDLKSIHNNTVMEIKSTLLPRIRLQENKEKPVGNFISFFSSLFKAKEPYKPLHLTELSPFFRYEPYIYSTYANSGYSPTAVRLNGENIFISSLRTYSEYTPAGFLLRKAAKPCLDIVFGGNLKLGYSLDLNYNITPFYANPFFFKPAVYGPGVVNMPKTPPEESIFVRVIGNLINPRFFSDNIKRLKRKNDRVIQDILDYNLMVKSEKSKSLSYGEISYNLQQDELRKAKDWVIEKKKAYIALVNSRSHDKEEWPISFSCFRDARALHSKRYIFDSFVSKPMPVLFDYVQGMRDLDLRIFNHMRSNNKLMPPRRLLRKYCLMEESRRLDIQLHERSSTSRFQGILGLPPEDSKVVILLGDLINPSDFRSKLSVLRSANDKRKADILSFNFRLQTTDVQKQRKQAFVDLKNAEQFLSIKKESMRRVDSKKESIVNSNSDFFFKKKKLPILDNAKPTGELSKSNFLVDFFSDNNFSDVLGFFNLISKFLEYFNFRLFFNFLQVEVLYLIQVFQSKIYFTTLFFHLLMFVQPCLNLFYFTKVAFLHKFVKFGNFLCCFSNVFFLFFIFFLLSFDERILFFEQMKFQYFFFYSFSFYELIFFILLCFIPVILLFLYIRTWWVNKTYSRKLIPFIEMHKKSNTFFFFNRFAISLKFRVQICLNFLKRPVEFSIFKKPRTLSFSLNLPRYFPKYLRLKQTYLIYIPWWPENRFMFLPFILRLPTPKDIMFPMPIYFVDVFRFTYTFKKITIFTIKPKYIFPFFFLVTPYVFIFFLFFFALFLLFRFLQTLNLVSILDYFNNIKILLNKQNKEFFANNSDIFAMAFEKQLKRIRIKHADRLNQALDLSTLFKANPRDPAKLRELLLGYRDTFLTGLYNDIDPEVPDPFNWTDFYKLFLEFNALIFDYFRVSVQRPLHNFLLNNCKLNDYFLFDSLIDNFWTMREFYVLKILMVFSTFPCIIWLFLFYQFFKLCLVFPFTQVKIIRRFIFYYDYEKNIFLTIKNTLRIKIANKEKLSAIDQFIVDYDYNFRFLILNFPFIYEYIYLKNKYKNLYDFNTYKEYQKIVSNEKEDIFAISSGKPNKEQVLQIPK